MKGQENQQGQSVPGALCHLGSDTEKMVEDEGADRAEGKQGEQNRDPSGDQEDEQGHADERFTAAHHGNGNRVVLVRRRGDKEVQNHGNREPGQNHDSIIQASQSCIDDRMGDAHQLDVEQQGKEEEGNGLLGQVDISQEGPPAGNKKSKSVVWSAWKSACRPSSWPSPQ